MSRGQRTCAMSRSGVGQIHLRRNSGFQANLSKFVAELFVFVDSHSLQIFNLGSNWPKFRVQKSPISRNFRILTFLAIHMHKRDRAPPEADLNGASSQDQSIQSRIFSNSFMAQISTNLLFSFDHIALYSPFCVMHQENRNLVHRLSFLHQQLARRRRLLLLVALILVFLLVHTSGRHAMRLRSMTWSAYLTLVQTVCLLHCSYNGTIVKIFELRYKRGGSVPGRDWKKRKAALAYSDGVPLKNFLWLNVPDPHAPQFQDHEYDAKLFKKYFRVNPDTFDYILGVIGPDIAPHPDAVRKDTLTARQR